MDQVIDLAAVGNVLMGISAFTSFPVRFSFIFFYRCLRGPAYYVLVMKGPSSENPTRRTPRESQKTMSLSTSRSLASLALNNLGFSTDNIDLSCLVGNAWPILNLPSGILRENYLDLPRKYQAFPSMCCADPVYVMLKKFRDPTI